MLNRFDLEKSGSELRLEAVFSFFFILFWFC